MKRAEEIHQKKFYPAFDPMDKQRYPTVFKNSRVQGTTLN